MMDLVEDAQERVNSARRRLKEAEVALTDAERRCAAVLSCNHKVLAFLNELENDEVLVVEELFQHHLNKMTE